MRRLHGGWLAAMALLFAGCGPGDRADDAAPTEPAAVAVPTIAVSARAPAPVSPVERLRVVVTSEAGIGSPGLDVLVTVLSARPELDVVVVAPSSGPTTGTTMSGFPAEVTGDSAASALSAVLHGTSPPDLVVVGIDEHGPTGRDTLRSPTVEAARLAARAGVPAVAVTAGSEAGVDYAAVGLLVGHLLDLELDRLTADAVAHVLTVPSCAAGTVRGPVVTDLGDEPDDAAPDCTSPDAHHGDDVTAHAHGYATLVELDP